MTRQLAVVCLLWGTACAATADEPAYRFSKQVDTPAIEHEELLAVELDADVFAATQDDLADLRIFDAEGNEISFLRRKASTTRTQTERQTWTGRDPAVRPLEGGGLEITLRLDKDDPQPGGVCIVTTLRNFEQRVRVSSSADGQTWQPAGDETVIFDYSRYMDVRSDCLAFPKTADRHFRIVIDDVTAEQVSELLELTRRLRGGDETERTERVTIDRRPFRIERVEFWRDVSRKQVTGERKTAYPIAGFRVSEDNKESQTIVDVDTRREPLTSLVLETTSRNFSRRAVVQVQETHGVQTSWRTIGEATVSRIDFKNLQREQLEVTFPEARREQYRIVIENRDSPPLEVTAVNAFGPVYELVYLAAPEQSNRLVYGADESEPPAYDTEAVAALLREGYRPSQTDLGKQEESALAAGERPFKWSRLLNDTRLLVGVILLLVIALGWGLYRATRRLEKIE